MPRFGTQIEFCLDPIITFSILGTTCYVFKVCISPKDYLAFITMGLRGNVGGWEARVNLKTGEFYNPMRGYVDVPQNVIREITERVRGELNLMCRDLSEIDVGWND